MDFVREGDRVDLIIGVRTYEKLCERRLGVCEYAEREDGSEFLQRR